MQKNEVSIIDGVIKAAYGDPRIPDYSENNQSIPVLSFQEPACA